MFIAFSILFRILDYFYVPKTLYWTFGSFVAEAFISSLIWIESFDAFFVEIKRLFSKKYFYKSTEDLEDLEILRTYPYFFLLVLLSKILVFYEWTIWEAVTLPILFSFTPYTMNFCSKTLKSLHDAREDDMYLPSTRNFSQQENSPVKDYYNVSIHSVFGYSNLFLFAVFSNLMTKDEISDLKAALICIGYVIHFSPVLLVKNTFKTKNLQDFMFIGLVLNLGTIMLPLSQKILVNILFIAVSSLIKGLDKYFYPLQLTLAVVAFNLSLLQKGTQGIEVQQFLFDNKMFMLVLIAITFFLSICLLAPTKTLIRYVYLYKDVNKGLFAVVLVLFIKMWEDVDMSSTTLDDILNNFENSFKLTSQFVILNGLALSLITKFALLTYHISDAVSLVEAGADPEYADCLIFLMTRDEEHRIKDSFYIYALKKTSDHMLILIAVLFNLVYFDTPWLRIIINFVISAFHSKSTPIIYKINLISFGSQFVIFSVFKTVFMYLLEGLNAILALNLFKAGILAWKVDPYRYDAIRYGFIRGPELEGIPKASTGWQIAINCLVLLVVIIPLNLLEYYTKTKQYKKNKAQVKRAVELILELGGIVLVWVLIYAPLYDSVFFLCISSYFVF